MVGLDAIRKANSTLKAGPAGLVGLFVGATSGIGEASLRSFFQHANAPRAYFVGRNEEAANKIMDELRKLNPEGKIEFLQGDMSLMKNVDAVAEKFKVKEKELNLLVMSQGFLTMEGRNETTEGIDKKLACNYYGRARFIHDLLPQLEAGAAANSAIGARVISVLGAGRENTLNFDDLALKNTFSIRTAERHACTFTTAIFEYLASQHPTVSFVHAMPGGVNTNIMGGSNFPWYVRVPLTVMSPLFKYILIDPKESGERYCYVGTQEQFKTGAHYINQKTESIAASKKAIENGIADKSVGEKVWRHSEEVWSAIPV